MCLYVSKSLTKSVKKRFKNGRMVCYKILKKSWGCLYSPYHNLYWNFGNINSDRYDKIIVNECVFNGIHVHSTVRSAEKFIKKNLYYSYYIIVPVICKEKDFIAAGYSDCPTLRNSHDTIDNQAVFTKVYLRKKDYQKALKA